MVVQLRHMAFLNKIYSPRGVDFYLSISKSSVGGRAEKCHRHFFCKLFYLAVILCLIFNFFIFVTIVQNSWQNIILYDKAIMEISSEM